ncbi:MAG: prepilin-type N-terminal cleavage/methylation domain-containing protein [Desulfobacterales bacterium]|nr:prepilin-type N-terminal cleavage/methylation domain-containing protein [Desulfobacterales bacterium]
MDANSLSHRSRQQSCTGFSLIEVLVAMAIFSIGILAVYSMQIYSIRGNTSARGITENITLASAKVEELLAQTYDHADLDVGLHQATVPGGYQSLQWQVSEDCLGADFQGHKCVQVRVTSVASALRQKDIRIDFVKANL